MFLKTFSSGSSIWVTIAEGSETIFFFASEILSSFKPAITIGTSGSAKKASVQSITFAYLAALAAKRLEISEVPAKTATSTEEKSNSSKFKTSSSSSSP